MPPPSRPRQAHGPPASAPYELPGSPTLKLTLTTLRFQLPSTPFLAGCVLWVPRRVEPEHALGPRRARPNTARSARIPSFHRQHLAGFSPGFTTAHRDSLEPRPAVLPAAWKPERSSTRPTSRLRQPLPTWRCPNPAAQAIADCDQPIHPVAPSWAVCVSALASCRSMGPSSTLVSGYWPCNVWRAGRGDDCVQRGT